ncbi:MAG: hypothetical protein LUH05_09025 [Candidatus Gastranaerophilales bacterium]|nr:hypothetical protein [Candidatus Gastranaerophilales bacterium]
MTIQVLADNNISDDIITKKQKRLIMELGDKIKLAKTLLKVSESADELGYIDITKDGRINLSSMFCNIFDEIVSGYEKLQIELKVK